MSKRFALGCALAALVGLATLHAGEKLKSGLQPGEKTSAFHVRDVTGPSKGTSLCYVCQYGPRPVVLAFARDVNTPLTGLVKELDKAVAAEKDSKLAAFVVFLTDSREKLEPKVADLGKNEKIQNVPLTILEGVGGPEKYKVAKEADLTVILYSKGEAKANFAFEKGKFDEKAAKEIVAAIPKITK